jgi:DNA repair ATPase RecN
MATPGSYISSSHKVYPEGSYEAVLDYTEDLSTGLEAWLSYAPASAEPAAACTDVSDNGEVSYCVTDRYDYLAPRLDNLQEKSSVIISTLSAYSDRLDKVIDTLDEYHTALTVTSERVSEIQDCLNDFRNTLTSGYHSLREDAAKLQVQADAHAEVFLAAVTNYTASLAAKMDKEHTEHKACCEAIHSNLLTLTQCVQELVRQQERILYNQERRGIWARIKSLFGK